MENDRRPVSPPGGTLLCMYSGRLGRTLCAFSGVAALLCLLASVSVFVVVTVAVIGMMLILVTVGLIFVIVPDYFDKFHAWLDGASSAAVFLGEIQPYPASAGIACAACAVVLLLLDREKRHIPSVVLCVLFLLCALLSFRLTEG